jgi:hypothetical protein
MRAFLVAGADLAIHTEPEGPHPFQDHTTVITVTNLRGQNTQIALRALFTRFPGIRPAVPVEELRWRRTRLMRGLEALPVVP